MNSNCKTLFINVSDAAKILGFTYQGVYKMIKNGDIKATRAGKSWRIYKDDFMNKFGITEEEAFGE